MAEDLSKKCSKCSLYKEYTEFYIEKKTNKLYSRCKECEKEKLKINREKGRCKNSDRRKWLISNYNISLKDYGLFLLKQDGRCAICKIHQNELNYSLCVDHDHITNKVRGLLCKGCNSGLGFFQDSKELLENARRYLK